jgi:hypothetical protein
VPKRWNIEFFSGSETWKWVLLADGKPVYESPETYASENECKAEIDKVKKADVSKRRP